MSTRSLAPTHRQELLHLFHFLLCIVRHAQSLTHPRLSVRILIVESRECSRGVLLYLRIYVVDRNDELGALFMDRSLESLFQLDDEGVERSILLGDIGFEDIASNEVLGFTVTVFF